MTLIQCLKIYHQVFLEFLDYIEELKQSGKVTGLKEAVFGIAKVLKKHEEIEDRYLFLELHPFLGEEKDPVGVMDFERKELRSILRSLEQAKKDREIIMVTGKFIACLRYHIEKEETILFPKAEESLGKDKLESLAEMAIYPEKSPP